MEAHKRFLMEQNALKIYIYACGFGLTIYAGLLCFGLRTTLAEWIAMSFAFVLLTGGAWLFRLCWLSYSFIAYMYVVRCCILMQHEQMFGEWLDLAHWIVFGLGCVLCLYFLVRIRHYMAL